MSVICLWYIEFYLFESVFAMYLNKPGSFKWTTELQSLRCYKLQRAWKALWLSSKPVFQNVQHEVLFNVTSILCLVNGNNAKIKRFQSVNYVTDEYTAILLLVNDYVLYTQFSISNAYDLEVVRRWCLKSNQSIIELKPYSIISYGFYFTSR